PWYLIAPLPSLNPYTTLFRSSEEQAGFLILPKKYSICRHPAVRSSKKSGDRPPRSRTPFRLRCPTLFSESLRERGYPVRQRPPSPIGPVGRSFHMRSQRGEMLWQSSSAR